MIKTAVLEICDGADVPTNFIFTVTSRDADRFVEAVEDYEGEFYLDVEIFNDPQLVNDIKLLALHTSLLDKSYLRFLEGGSELLEAIETGNDRAVEALL